MSAIITDTSEWDTGPGHPVSGCGENAVAWTAVEHYLEAERCLIRQRFNRDSARALAALDAEARTHYLAAIATAMIERGQQ